MNDRHRLSGSDHDGSATGACGRSDDLVAYLYGEASPEGRRLFAEHLKSCVVCRDELAAFRGVREEVGAWREEVLSVAPRLDLSGALAQTTAAASARPPRRRSALLALREFFALSPWWLQAAATVAILAICALAALTYARTEIRWDENGVAFRGGVQTQTNGERLEVPAPGTLTTQQADELAQRRVREALEAQRMEFEQELQTAVVKAREESLSNRPASVLTSGESQLQRNRAVVRKRANRQNLENARDEDEGLPGLYDLLREAN